MGTVRYTVINGETVAEKRNGVRSLYVPDSLGSTRALLDNTQTQTDTFTYWPYGETVHLTGTNPTPFTFVGTQGYHADNTTKTYVRARVVEPPKTRWLTEDPIGFAGADVNLYRYVLDNPVSQIDKSGLSYTNKECKAACDLAFTKNKDRQACYKLCTSLGGNSCGALRARCNHLDRHPSEGSAANCWELYKELCQPKDNPTEGCSPAVSGLANCSTGAGIVICVGLATCIVLCVITGNEGVIVVGGGKLKQLVQ